MASWSNQWMMERNFKKTNQPTSLPATTPLLKWACFVREKGEISWTLARTKGEHKPNQKT